MALSRKFLKALGIEDDKIDEIINAHAETVTALNEKIDEAKQGVDSLATVTKERDDLKTQLEALQKSSGDAAKVQADFDAYKAQIEAEKTNAGKKALVRKALEGANANSAALDLLLNTIDLSKVELDGDKLKDAEAVLKPVKESHAALFGTTVIKGTDPITPPGGTGKPEKALTLAEALHQKYDNNK